MSLIRPKSVYKSWMIRLPLEIKEQFKVRCKEDKVDMIDRFRQLVRDYVNETKELYEEKRIIEIEPFTGEKGKWKMSNFPCKLRAEFKSCCGARGDSIGDASAYLIKSYLKEENDG